MRLLWVRVSIFLCTWLNNKIWESYINQEIKIIEKCIKNYSICFCLKYMEIVSRSWSRKLIDIKLYILKYKLDEINLVSRQCSKNKLSIQCFIYFGLSIRRFLRSTLYWCFLFSYIHKIRSVFCAWRILENWIWHRMLWYREKLR